MNKKRKDIEKIIIDTFNILDKTGRNANFYKEFFKNMNDNQFNSYMKKFLNDEKSNFYLEVTPFMKNGEPTIQDIKDAADYLEVPLNEYVYMPYANPDGEAVRSPYPVPVGYLHMKRLRAKRFLETLVNLMGIKRIINL